MDKQKLEKDIDALINRGKLLYLSLHLQFTDDKDLRARTIKAHGNLVDFTSNYQEWYSEAIEAIRQFLPARLNDFVSNYEWKGQRKQIDITNYMIKDALEGIQISRGSEVIVSPGSAVTKVRQQANIVASLTKTYSSSLFNIKTLVEADLYDNELKAAEDLNKKGFQRAAGAVAGVVIEHHLATVCENHSIKIVPKNTTISTLNDLLKDNEIYDTAVWRNIQYLGDIRNKCDHKKEKDPTKDEIDSLIEGTNKILKTIF